MIRSQFCFAVLVSLVPALGCDDPKKPVAPAATASGAPTTAPAPVATPAPIATPAATATTLAERLKCSTLLPDSALTAVGLSTMKVAQVAATCADCGPTCTLTSPGKPFEGVTVKYDCRTKQPKDVVDKELKKASADLKKSGPVAGLGRGAVGGEREAGMFYQVLAYDDDSACSINVEWMRGKKNDAQNVAKAALAGIKQSDLP
jgi:hypothetical protein